MLTVFLSRNISRSLAICLVCAGFGGSLAHAEESLVQLGFYSETVYDARIEGAVTDSRLRAAYPFLNKSLLPYLGLNFSRDLSNGSAPEAIENAWSPSLGVIYRFPRWISLLAEKRYLYRTDPRPQQASADEEFRYGLVFYEKLGFRDRYFAEAYGEWIAIDRVSEEAVAAAWLKLGHDTYQSSEVTVSPFGELFSRQSPDLGYGPTENEVRLGVRASTTLGGMYLSAIIHQSLYSNTAPGGLDALVVISGGTF